MQRPGFWPEYVTLTFDRCILLTAGYSVSVVTGWASVNEGVDGPAVYDVVTEYLRHHGSVDLEVNQDIRIV